VVNVIAINYVRASVVAGGGQKQLTEGGLRDASVLRGAAADVFLTAVDARCRRL